jgi:hypothetical protein
LESRMLCSEWRLKEEYPVVSILLHPWRSVLIVVLSSSITAVLINNRPEEGYISIPHVSKIFNTIGSSRDVTPQFYPAISVYGSRAAHVNEVVSNGNPSRLRGPLNACQVREFRGETTTWLERMGTGIQPPRELAWVLNQVDGMVAMLDEVIIPLSDLWRMTTGNMKINTGLIFRNRKVYKRYKEKENKHLETTIMEPWVLCIYSWEQYIY